MRAAFLRVAPSLAALLIGTLAASTASAQMRTVTLPDKSPVVEIRLVFTTGSAFDPPGKEGLANLTASMLAGGGTKSLTYQQVTDALFPLASGVRSQVDQEMTVFAGRSHTDNLNVYYGLLRQMLLEPGWREDDFRRLKDAHMNSLKVGLRSNNDEELGKEVLHAELFRGTPYGHPSIGTVSGIESITLDDVKDFYKRHYSQSNLIVGLAGGYSADFLSRVKKDFGALPEKDATPALMVKPAAISHTNAVIVEKNTRSVAYSLGFPIEVKRGSPDYPALLVMQSYLGPHRMSSGRLFQSIRGARGINYGDYAYIEAFPRGDSRMEPEANIARRSQIFQIWLRPAEPPQAGFALRLGLYELARLVKSGLSQADFDNARQFVSKYVNVLTKTKDAELGYAIDSLYYGIPEYTKYVKDSVAKLTRDQVNAAIKKYLRTDRLTIAVIGKDAPELKRELTGTTATPIEYNSPKPDAVLAEDKVVQKWDTGLRTEDIRIVPVEAVFP